MEGRSKGAGREEVGRRKEGGSDERGRRGGKIQIQINFILSAYNIQ